MNAHNVAVKPRAKIKLWDRIQWIEFAIAADIPASTVNLSSTTNKTIVNSPV